MPDAVRFPDNADYGCVNCGSVNHTTGDVTWCPDEQDKEAQAERNDRAAVARLIDGSDDAC